MAYHPPPQIGCSRPYCAHANRRPTEHCSQSCNKGADHAPARRL